MKSFYLVVAKYSFCVKSGACPLGAHERHEDLRVEHSDAWALFKEWTL